MQGIYTYIPETNHVPKEYNVAAILSLLFMAPISLASVLALIYFYISTFRSMYIIIIIVVVVVVDITEFGLIRCGSSTVHIYTHITQNTKNGKYIKNKIWNCGLCELYPGICFTPEEKSPNNLI
jgi:hypothetical protein